MEPDDEPFKVGILFSHDSIPHAENVTDVIPVELCYDAKRVLPILEGIDRIDPDGGVGLLLNHIANAVRRACFEKDNK
jgi:hypothetical protein